MAAAVVFGTVSFFEKTSDSFLVSGPFLKPTSFDSVIAADEI